MTPEYVAPVTTIHIILNYITTITNSNTTTITTTTTTINTTSTTTTTTTRDKRLHLKPALVKVTDYIYHLPFSTISGPFWAYLMLQ